ncbi:MAG: hypothetical protein R6V54_10595 [Desulfobacteraceae bacterium]
MLSPGFLIAMDVTILYAVMGPLVLFALYVVFDALAGKKQGDQERMIGKEKKDPALRVDEDILL